MLKFLPAQQKLKNIDYIMVGCLIVLAFVSAYFISSISYLKYKNIVVKLPPSISTDEENVGKIDVELILQANPFNLDIYNQERMQAVQRNSQGGNVGNVSNTGMSSGEEFKGQLVGILKGQDRSYALIRREDKFYILSEGEVKDGITVDNIGVRDVIVIYQSKKYQLKLVSDESKKVASMTTININNDAETGTIKRAVTRKDVEENLSDINSLINTMYISPYYLGGEFVGYRIARMRMDAFLRKAGLENGDVLVRMNGERINTPEKMFELFAKWKDASAVTIDIIRRDQKRTVFVEIE
jgi:general secretion pathway protein C